MLSKRQCIDGLWMGELPANNAQTQSQHTLNFLTRTQRKLDSKGWHLHLDTVSVPGISQHWIELLVLKERSKWSGHLHHPNTHTNHSAGTILTPLHVPLLHCQGSASSTIHRHLHNSSFKEKGYSRKHEDGWILGSGPWSGFCVQRWLILIQSEHTNTHLCGLQKKVKFYCIFAMNLLG